MISRLRRWLPKPPPAPAVLLGAERFVIARFEPTVGANPREQASLAIEATSPFPQSQLLQGSIRSDGGAEGLAYAAHRRAFGGESAADWPADAPVIPEFLALLGDRPPEGGVVVHVDARRSLALAWRAGEALPGAMACVAADEGSPADAATEAADAAGLPPDAARREVEGGLKGWRDELGVGLRRGEGPVHRIATTQVDDLDVRDPDFLEARQRAARWDGRVWRTAQVGAGLAVAALLAELGSWGLGLSADGTRERSATAEPRVRELQSLHALAAKVEELGRNRPLPFEMLAVANTHRPPGLVFTSATQRTSATLELEARTSAAADVGTLEQALSSDPLLAKVETRDIRGRDGVTTFALTLTFKPEALRKAAAGTP